MFMCGHAVSLERLTGTERRLESLPTVNRSGTGEPVLLLHGFTLSHHVWHAVVDDLASDFDVVAMSMPEHWGPRLPLAQTGVRGTADGIERELDALGLAMCQCHVAGNSLGG